MADTVDITAGTGTTIATDDVAGVHYQRVKLTDGTADSSAVIPGDATNGLDVDVTRVQGTVTVDGSGSTQPVSGTVTADAGTGDFNVSLQDGAGTDLTSTLVGADQSLDVNITQSVALDASGATVTVANAGLTELAAAINTNELDVNIATDSAGLATSANQPAVYTDDTSTHSGASEGNLLMAAATPTDTAVDANDIGAIAMSTDRRLHVDSDIVAQSVGNLSVNIAADAVGLATSANQLADGHNVTVDNTTGSPANVQIGDGTSQATVRNLAANDSLNVAIVDGAGDQITSFGGGTQYTEADTDATIVGTVAMWEDTGDTLRAPSAANPFPVEVIAGATSGTEYTDDTDVHATGTTAGGIIMAAATPTDTAVDANDIGAVAMSTDRRLHVDAQIVGTDADVNVNINADAVGLATSAAQLPDGHNVTVDNGAAGAAVNIQDGGNDISVDNAGTFAVQDSEKVADNAGFTDGTTPVQPSGYVFDEVAGTALTENDAAAARIDSKRAQVFVIEDETTRGRRATVTASNELAVLASAQPGVDIGDVTLNNASLTVAQATAANLNATTVGYTSATDADGSGNTVAQGTHSSGSAKVSSANHVFNGTTWDRTRGNTTAQYVHGPVAQDTASTANPVIDGGTHETMADSAPANRVGTDGDANRLSTTDGALYVIPCGPQAWSYHLDTSTAQTDASVHASPGAGLSLYVTDIVFSSGAATAINLFFEESTTTVLGPYYLEAVAGRGMSVHFGTPKKITAATALTLTTSASIAHSVDVTGFVAPG